MRRLWKNHKGVTMMEVMVTVAILGIVVVPCLSSFVVAQRGNVRAKQTYGEYTEAANLMEELKASGQTLEQDALDDLCQAKYPAISATVTLKEGYMIITIIDAESEEEILEGVVITE